MWVAHLFSDKFRMRCHRSPEFCNGSDLQPTRTYCRTALHARSQGAVIGQGSVAESWLAVTQGACTNGQTCAVTFAENNRLFDGEARCCCKSVDNHTSVMRTRVAPTMRAACAAERADIRTGKVAACFAHTFASEASTWAFAVLHLDFPALSVDPPSAVVGLQHFHDWLDACTMQSCLYWQRNGPEEDGRPRCSGSWGSAQHRRYCFANTAKVALHWLP